MHVIDVFQRVDQFEQLAALLTIELNLGGCTHCDLGVLGLKASSRHRFFDINKVLLGGQHLNRTIITGDHVIGAGFKRSLHEGVFITAGRIGKDAELFKQIGNRSLRPHVAAKLAEGMLDVRDRSVLVVGHGVHHDGDPVDAITLVAVFFIDNIIELTCALLDRTLDGVLGHVSAKGLVYGKSQARIGRHVRATHLRSDRDFADELGKQLAAFRVLRVLAVLDVGPFTMTGHRGFSSVGICRAAPDWVKVDPAG